jgi:hypothetical protein
MEWQQIVALSLVALTASLMARNAARRWLRSPLRAHGACLCPGSAGQQPPPSILYHARKGERPRIIIRDTVVPGTNPLSASMLHEPKH